MKKLITSCALATLMVALNLPAQSTDGWRGANNMSNPTWDVPGNWSAGHVPGTDPAPGDKAAFNSRDHPPCFITNAAAPAQFVMGDGNPSIVYLMSGGSLTTSNYAGGDSWNAISYSHFSRFELRPGSSFVNSNHLWIGLNRNARGNFVMNGGNATVLGMIGLGWNGGIGVAQVNGGTLTLAQWNDVDSIKPLSQLDIRGGTVIITNGDHTASIANYVADGRITGYGGVGTVNYSFDDQTGSTVLTASTTPGAGGPYPVTDWPTNINPELMVHYWTVDGSLFAPNPNWSSSLGLVQGGDQAITDVTLRGLPGKQGTSTYFNIYDEQWEAWNTNGLVDVLLCVYGDGNLMRPNDPYQCKRFQFQLGTSPTDGATTVYGGLIPTNIVNSKWNWVMFTVTNNYQSNLVDRLMGSLRTNAPSSGTNFGGINGGTMRIYGPSAETVNGVSIRAVAFGQHGAFGTAPDVNQFEAPDESCPPVLDVNLVGIDFNAGYTNHLQVINDPGTLQGVTYVGNAGPPDDQRKAVIPTSYYLNFGILDNYLGRPCNDNVPMKVCVDYYDDPSFAGLGVQFGPQAYAVDEYGNVGYVPDTSLATLQGTGRWVRQSWTIRGVNLVGVSTAPLTGGPQFVSINGQVAVSRFYLAAIRTTGPLANQDPLAECYPDPNICTGLYSNYAELDLNSITNGIDLASSGGDQTFVVEMAGPADDQRLSVRPDTPTAYYLNFALGDTLGPISQGNLHLAIAVTYYDDPALAGIGFRPEVWTTQNAGALDMAHMPSSANMVLTGTDKWREAYWEIGTISLDGVNQHPAAARFTCNGPLHISRVRYAVIRPCGAEAGENLLSNTVSLSAVPDTDGLLKLSWPAVAPQAVVEAAPTIDGPWTPFTGGTLTFEGENSVLRFDPANADSQYFRLTLTPQ